MNDSNMLRVLVVEDHEDVAEVTVTYLELLGYRPTLARNVADALRLATREPYDVVLTDFSLPDGTGMEFLCQLKPSVPRLPVLLLTAYNKEFLDPLAMAGFAGYLQKPIDLDDLNTAVQSAARRASI
jgi:CheY-like chemotaxis protein